MKIKRGGFGWDIARTKPFSNIPTALPEQSWEPPVPQVVLPAGSECLLLLQCPSPPQWVCVKPRVPNLLQSGFCSESHPSSATHYLFILLLTEKRPLPSKLRPAQSWETSTFSSGGALPSTQGFFGYAHQIKPPQTQGDSLTARAASLLHKQERQFPSHTKDSYGIAANPCFPGI